jgi:hypothetical protein
MGCKPLPSHDAFAFGIERGFQPRVQASRKAATALPKTGPPTSVFARWGVTPERSPKGEATDLLHLFFSKTAQKSHVKPQNRLNATPSIT